MGLLDDAIREHMELKRLRGADPGEVARQEHDALGPVVREHDPEDSALEDDGQGDEDPHPNSDPHDLGTGDPTHEDGAGVEGDLSVTPSRAPHPERGADFANVGQETAELDMRTVLGGHPEGGLEETPGAAGETSGQEQLWLDQQRAPRDFDFDG
jgi:hypothetical protein